MSTTRTSIIVAIVATVLVNLLLKYVRQRRIRKQMPPGPPGLPGIGNVHQLTPFGWYQFTEWKQIYGPIFSLDFAGQPVVVFNDFSVTADLIDRRSAIYSDRPRLIMLGEIMTRGLTFTMTRYNDLWRSMHKAASECLSPNVIRTYRPSQEMHGYMLLSHFLKSPDRWQKHIRFAQTSSLFHVVYGLTPQELYERPHIVEDVDAFLREGAAATMPGTYFVDIFPWMVHFPRWLAPWKRFGDIYYERNTALFKSLLDDARAKRSSTTATHTLSVDLSEMQNKGVLNQTECAWLCGTTYAAGAETSATILELLILVMLLYPEKIRRVQEQIDQVVGRGRLPTFADIDDLPRLHALVREVIRWRPPAPRSLPKRCTQDNWYKGYLIPEGTLVIENVWAMNHDSKYFRDPAEFEPERFLGSDGRLLDAIPDTHGYSHASFGAGRRICVGKDLAMQGLLITAATVLWGAEVLPAVDATGEPIMPSPSDLVDHGVVVRPAHFPCRIKPRDGRVPKAVEDALGDEYTLDI